MWNRQDVDDLYKKCHTQDQHLFYTSNSLLTYLQPFSIAQDKTNKDKQGVEMRELKPVLSNNIITKQHFTFLRAVPEKL